MHGPLSKALAIATAARDAVVDRAYRPCHCNQFAFGDHTSAPMQW